MIADCGLRIAELKKVQRWLLDAQIPVTRNSQPLNPACGVVAQSAKPQTLIHLFEMGSINFGS